MADGKVTIQIDMDGKKAQGDINSLKNSLSGLGSTFKSVLGANLVSGALIGGVKALAGGVKGAFSSAISEGAKLQQSIGGIETLFKGSAGKVKKYAESAFKTAGLSANEYMENVTSFSASLIQSLGGDTEKAADLANTALMDMSDNANKMGTDMERITETYQSLARGNYQMLDNLKLGYGGTKAEMKRLIKDAASYKDVQKELNMTVDESDLSFGNMVKAISVVQKKLGITGTTAKEASETFSGSFAAMQGAFKDFLGNLTTGGNIEKPLENLAKTASTFVFKNFIPMVANAFKSLPKAIGKFIESAGPEIEAGLRKILPKKTVDNIMSTFDKIGAMFDGFKNSGALTAIADAWESIKDAMGHVFDSLAGNKETFESIGDAVGDVAKFLADAAKAGADFVKSLPPGTIRNIAGAILGVVAAIKTIKTAQKVISGLKSSIELVNSVLNASPMAKFAFTIGVLVAWFVQAYTTSESFRNKVNEVAKAIGDAAKKVGDFISKIDPSMFTMILPGIAAVIAKFKGFGFLNKFNPFKLFQKNAGTALDGLGNKTTQKKGLIEQVFSGLGTLLEKVASSISTVINSISSGLSKIIESFGTAASKANPGQWLSMAAALAAVGLSVFLASAGLSMLADAAIRLGDAGAPAQIAMGLLVVSIGALAGLFALLGPALTAGSAGFLAFGGAIALASGGIAALLLALSQCGPAFTALGNALATVITALGTGLATVINSIATGIATVVQSISTGIAQIAVGIGAGLQAALSGVASVIQSVGSAIQSVLQGIATVVQSVGNSIKSVLEGIGNVFTSVGNAIKTACEGVSNVIKSMGDAIRNVLDGVKGVIEAIGDSFTKFADGLVKVAQNAGGIMAAAGAVTALAGATVGLQGAMVTIDLRRLADDWDKVDTSLYHISTRTSAISPGLTQIVAAFSRMQSIGSGVNTALSSVESKFGSFADKAKALPGSLTGVQSALSGFANNVKTALSGLDGATASLTKVQSSIKSISSGAAPAQLLVSAFSALSAGASSLVAALSGISGQMNAVAGAGNTLRASLASIASQIPALNAGLATIGTSGTATMITFGTAVRTAMATALSSVRSSMTQMASAVKQSSTQMTQAGKTAGKGVSDGISNGIKSGVPKAQSAMRSMVNSIKSAGQSGVSTMRQVGSMIGQGLAQGMRSALGSVTAAANALVAQAERAARAKARIHSPSRLFRDSVGRFLPMGVAVGIEKNTKYVDKAMGGMFDQINAFSYKAEDVIGVGNTKLSKVVQVKSDFENAIKAKVEVAKEKTNNLVEKALDVAEKAVSRPNQMVLDDGTLVAETGDKYGEYLEEQTRRRNRMRGILE